MVAILIKKCYVYNDKGNINLSNNKTVNSIYE